MQFSDPQANFITKEARLCRSVMGLKEKEAIRIIEQNECIAFVEQRDKNVFRPKLETGFSYRIKLTVLRGKVINTSIG